MYIWPSILSQLKTYIYDMCGGNVLSVNLFEHSPDWGLCCSGVQTSNSAYSSYSRWYTYLQSASVVVGIEPLRVVCHGPKNWFCPSLHKTSMLSKNFGFAPPCKSLACYPGGKPEKRSKILVLPLVAKV